MSARKARISREMQSYVFEIEEWKPEYSWFLNQDKFRDVPYREHLTLDLHTKCVFPPKFVGREVLFALLAERDAIKPYAFQQDPEWGSRCVGLLSLRPNDGRFYISVPHDNFAPLLTSLAHGLFRFVDVYGPAMKYGKSECTSFRLMRSFNSEDY